jgi:hypothetical protein
MTAAQNITELFNGYKFTSTTITYSFLTEYAPYTSQGIQEPGGPTLLTDAQKDATRQLFADIQSFLGVQFVEVIQDNSQNQIGQIAIGMRGNMPDLFVGDALPPYSNGAGEAGDIWIKAGHGGGAATDEFVATMLHEICHALGLRHPTFSDVQKTRRYTVDSTIRVCRPRRSCNSMTSARCNISMVLRPAAIQATPYTPTLPEIRWSPSGILEGMTP